jgi:hypothetical protein
LRDSPIHSYFNNSQAPFLLGLKPARPPLEHSGDGEVEGSGPHDLIPQPETNDTDQRFAAKRAIPS